MSADREDSHSLSRRALLTRGAGAAAALYGLGRLGPLLTTTAEASDAANLYRDSYWTEPIPSNPRVSSNSAAIADRVATEQAKGVNPLSVSAGPALRGESYEHPIYFARSSDPVRQFKLGDFGGWKPPIEGYRAHVPASAAASNGSDAHISIVQPDGVICDSWGSDLSTPGVIRASWADFATPQGHGTCTAGQFALFAGIITPEELIAAYRRPRQRPIKHALFMVSYWHSGIVWPTDREVQPNQRMLRDPSVPRFGERLWIDMTERELRSKPRHVRPIIRAMRDYGLYVGDTGGNAGGGARNGGLKVNSARPGKWKKAGEITGAPSLGGGNYLWDVRPHIDFRRQLKVLAS